jgi:hypothetical protein
VKRALPALDNVVQTEIGACREIQRQNCIVASGNVDRGNPMQVAVGDDFFNAVDLVRLVRRRSAKRSACCGVAPQRQRA